ncbi:MAG TPA: hypothetical protein DEG43_02985 [Acidimicrobiaceae bacterium]|jgi:hypothetical protein|nr:hypothetical protein [Acidimicrobiaceae bacterium]
MKPRPNPTNALAMHTIDRLVQSRYGAAVSTVREIQSQRPTASPTEISELLVKKYSRELAAVAALSGGAAAVPGAGTMTAVATAGADLALTLTKLGEMVLAIGIAHGHTAHSLAERKAWVLSVLSMSKGAVTGVEGLAGRVGTEGGARILAGISATQLETVNSRLATKLLGKLATEQATARLGRLLPFGIGAGVGAVGNLLIAKGVAKAANQFFAGIGYDPHAATQSPVSTLTTASGEFADNTAFIEAQSYPTPNPPGN